jgi:hypothetical protein
MNVSFTVLYVNVNPRTLLPKRFARSSGAGLGQTLTEKIAACLVSCGLVNGVAIGNLEGYLPGGGFGATLGDNLWRLVRFAWKMTLV